MDKEELLKLITDWIKKYPNPYNNDIEEKVYWTMQDTLEMVKCTNDKLVLEYCYSIFKRFQHYNKYK